MRWLALLFALGVVPVQSQQTKIDFARDIQPIFESRCLKCHGGKDTEASLSIVDRDTLLKGGTSGPAVLAGKGKVTGDVVSPALTAEEWGELY